MKISACLIIVCLLLTACGAKEEKKAYSGDQTVRVKNTTYKPERYKSNPRAAAHLEKLAADIPNVKAAKAVVLGPYAIVGIDVNSKLDRTRVETIKYTVAESIKHDPHGANAIVVADPDTYQRVQAMGKQIQKGNPQAVMTEFAAIIGRVMPQVPKDMLENKDSEPTKRNDKQLPEGEKQQLKKEQDDQSNQYMNAK
ncbi:YhcN/YlaJ family sporulation lipoprotein [Ectobacillus antri]|jgi:YhcN/YlaJ family sporulation lipoprotein|uniref:YhcN/YlaJ family sporulation lipoprotein n=1 Tax=Ectobacillus antri TaxID=2486280 RepID=A0ABT6H4K4_9BACI|nr:YhcN/YlaJ family sporulation lipoprotein [Ectobacillus antri]MDG4657047.1 YhcN/YlaJ family sporulation lipoprotein [Ectobacillus antri]MDG5754149.1 YhcN/YlaJ family sporulation lipoprotein [Ectobacillus antri]